MNYTGFSCKWHFIKPHLISQKKDWRLRLTRNGVGVCMQHLCEIIRRILGVQQGPCWSQASALLSKRERGRDTGGAYEIHYCCQGKPGSSNWGISVFIFSLYFRDRLWLVGIFLPLKVCSKNLMTQKFLDEAVCRSKTISRSSDTDVVFVIAIQRCSQTGNHWHSCTWPATCHCWQLNTSADTVGDASHSNQGHKTEMMLVPKLSTEFVFQPVCCYCTDTFAEPHFIA